MPIDWKLSNSSTRYDIPILTYTFVMAAKKWAKIWIPILVKNTKFRKCDFSFQFDSDFGKKYPFF